jgi:hypothetical protein
MKKKRFIQFAISTIVFGMLGFTFLYIYGFSISKSHYDAGYFTQGYLDKYSSPEMAFDHFIDALMSNDAENYQEVLGRKLTEMELKYFKEHPYEGRKKPEIVKMEKGHNYVYIVTDNNWGEFFEKVNDRWIFTPEDSGANIRAFFRGFK